MCGAALGLWRRLERWSYTWACAAVVVAAFMLVALVDDRPVLISVWVDALIELMLFGALLSVAFTAARRGRLDALLVGLGFYATFVLVSYSAVAVPPFRRVDLALLALPAGLAFSTLIAALLRGDAGLRSVAVVLAVVLGVSLMWLYAGAVSSGWESSVSRFATRVVQIAVLGLLGPVLMSWLLDLRRVARRM